MPPAAPLCARGSPLSRTLERIFVIRCHLQRTPGSFWTASSDRYRLCRSRPSSNAYMRCHSSAAADRIDLSGGVRRAIGETELVANLACQTELRVWQELAVGDLPVLPRALVVGNGCSCPRVRSRRGCVDGFNTEAEPTRRRCTPHRQGPRWRPPARSWCIR